MNFREYKLGEIADFNKSSISKSEIIKDIIYLDTGSITENVISDTITLDITEAPSRAQRKVEHHTIIYSTVRPRLKHYGLLENPRNNLIVSTGFTTIDLKEECKGIIDPRFLYLLLTQPIITEYIGNIADTAVSAYPSINSSDISTLTFNFPDFYIQNAIADLWESYDKKITLNRAINHNLEALAKQLYDYWFVQFDFPNEEGRPYKSSGGAMVYNENLKRNIPEGWNDGIFADIANITMGQSPDGKSYNENGEGEIFYQGSTDFGFRFPSVRMYTTSPTRFAKQGDILMSVRAPVGAVNIANTDCCIGRGLSAINSKIESTTYIYYVVHYLKVRFDNLNSAGTTFGSITKDDLFNLPVVIPPSEIVQQFERFCNPIFDKQMEVGSEIESLVKQRDELLPLLINGQATVNYDLSHD